MAGQGGREDRGHERLSPSVSPDSVTRGSSGHTPGPWTASVAVRNHGGWKDPTQHVQILADQILIADFDTAFVEYPDDPENEANARLIAAAPDMLAALRNVQKIISEAALTGFNWKDGDWAERLFASQQVTSAAIRSAIGAAS